MIERDNDEKVYSIFGNIKGSEMKEKTKTLWFPLMKQRWKWYLFRTIYLLFRTNDENADAYKMLSILYGLGM